jgi:hypothetical protein
VLIEVSRLRWWYVLVVVSLTVVFDLKAT